MPPPDAPFRKEWPLLSMKLMVWWAQRVGAEGLAWSSAALQLARWRGYGPPETLYRTILPDAARSVAKTLGLTFETTAVPVRANGRQVELTPQGWQVNASDGTPVTKPFQTRAQAERFADHTGQFVSLDLPVIWIDGLDRIMAVPLYGTATPSAWLSKSSKPAGRATTDEYKRPAKVAQACSVSSP